MNFRKTITGEYIMDIPERDNLCRALNSFGTHKSGKVERDHLFDCLIKYVDYLIGYCAAEIKGASYGFDHVVPQLFELNIKKEQQWKQYLKYSLYALQQYLVCLKAHKLHRKNVGRYHNFVLMLTSDVEWLVTNYEQDYKKSITQLKPTCFASRQLCSRELVWAMNELFFIDDCDDLASFDMRDVKPNFMFIVRQLLETLGNNLIGFSCIVDSNNKPIHKFTQVSWDYLAQSKVAKQCVSLPFKVSTIRKVNSWANSFVHVRYLHLSYIQFYALDFVNNLMKTPKDGVLCYDGKHLNATYGDFRIEHYNTLKADFETFVQKQHPNAKVEWLYLNDVGAYIISL